MCVFVIMRVCLQVLFCTRCYHVCMHVLICIVDYVHAYCYSHMHAWIYVCMQFDMRVYVIRNANAYLPHMNVCTHACIHAYIAHTCIQT